jgi:peptidoglycan/xylan/chitin deacetylase (PgdA/CDA1 family)
MYHSVLDDPRECADSIGLCNTHSRASFSKQMEILARSYHPVTVEDIRLFLSGQKTMPREAVVVTFDDGYADNFEVAAPVLNRVGIPGSFYLSVEAVESGSPPWFCHLRHAFLTTRKGWWSDRNGRVWGLANERERQAALQAASEYLTRFVGVAQQPVLQAIQQDLEAEPLATKKSLMMTWEQAKGLHRTGHRVGSHGLTHPNMACIGDEDLNYELTESKRRMEKALAMEITHFSYPAAALNVSWTERTVAATKRVGYQTAVTTTAGLVGPHASPLALCRLGSPDDLDEFRWKLQYASAHYSTS